MEGVCLLVVSEKMRVVQSFGGHNYMQPIALEFSTKFEKVGVSFSRLHHLCMTVKKK